MPETTFPNLIPALPEIFLAIAAMLLLMIGVFSKEKQGARTVGYGSVIVLIVAMVLVGLVTDVRALTFGGAFVTDPFAVFIKVMILIAAATAILMSRGYLEDHGINRFEFPVLVVLATLGMLMMVSANDLIALYLGLELQSLALYVIASFQRDSTRSAEAGLKYFVLGAVASGLLLYGMTLVYGFSGTTNFDLLEKLFSNSKGEASVGVIVGLVFIIAGLAFKISAVPFHMWTPDVYEGAPTPVTALFAIAPKIAAMGLFIRVMTGPFGDLSGQWQQIIIFISIASMVLGAFAAINQRNIKRLMAYSSIGHMGYALIGLAVTGQTDRPEVQSDGLNALLVYLAIYMIMNLGTFACILLMKKDGRMVEDIEDLAGLSKTNPALAAVFTIFMFSMAGIPPLAGFLGKLYIFQSAIQAELFGLAIIGVLASVVGAFYYLRIVKVMYFDQPEDGFDGPISLEIKSILVVTGFVILLFIFLPGPLLSGADAASASLFPG